MGKLPVPYTYTDSEETEDTSSSVENLKKKKRFSILKYTNGNVKKKKCKAHSISEPDESEFRSRSSQRVRKLRGILKHDRDRDSSDEDEELETVVPRPRDKYLVGRVPRPAGSRPGRGGGVAIVVRKNTDTYLEDEVRSINVNFEGLPVLQNLQAQSSTSSTKRRRSMKRLAKKRSY